MTVIHNYCRYGGVIYFTSSLIQSSEKPFPLKYPELWRRGAQVSQKHWHKNWNKSKTSQIRCNMSGKLLPASRTKTDQPLSDIKEILKSTLWGRFLVELENWRFASEASCLPGRHSCHTEFTAFQTLSRCLWHNVISHTGTQVHLCSSLIPHYFCSFCHVIVSKRKENRVPTWTPDLLLYKKRLMWADVANYSFKVFRGFNSWR